MNFLSHYYFERFAPYPERVLGVLLPDFLKNVNKKYNFQPQRFEEALYSSSGTTYILEGWYRHLEVDKLFHSSPFFVQHCHVLRKQLEPILVGLPIRASFMAHIAVELLLDHLLIHEGLINPIRLYEQLEAVNTGTIQRALTVLEGVDIPIFMQFYDRFLASRYVLEYAAMESVAYALFQICKRVWSFEFSDVQRENLAAELQRYVDTHKADFIAVFPYIQTRLS